MTPAEAAIREVLEAGPTEGPWHWDGDLIKGDPLNRIRYQVVACGKTITKCYYSSGDPQAQLDARHIAACNPAAIRTLLSELDALRARCEAGEALLAEARDTIDTLPGYPKGADCCDRIDAHLKGTGRE